MTQDLNEVLNDIGIGPYQGMQLLLVGGIVLTDGAEILVSSSLLTALSKVWHLTPTVKGLMMSTVFLGVFVGGLIGGNMADVYGRRRAILVAYIGLVIFGGAVSLAQGPLSMLFLRFLFGVCFGSGVAPALTMLTESSPSMWRSHILNFSSIWFMLGEVYVSIVLIFFMPDLLDPEGTIWRWVTLLSVVPGFIIFLFSCVLLQESPHYLLSQGKHEEAVKTLQYMARWNNKPDKAEEMNELELQLPMTGENTALVENSAPGSAMLNSTPSDAGAHVHYDARSSDSGSGPVSPRPEKQPGALDKVRESMDLLRSKEYRGIVLGGSYLCFLGNFLFYGLTYALPQVFRQLHHSLAPAYQVLFVSICDIPGVLLVFFFLYSKSIGHREGLTILAACCSVLSLTLISIEHGRGIRGIYWGLPSAYLIKYAAAAFFTLSYVYLSEVFPARVRASGIAFCISAGRVGSMSAPLVVEALHMKHFALFDHMVPHAPFLMLTSGLCLLGVIFIKTFLHFELKNAPLQNIPKPAGARERKMKDSERPTPQVQMRGNPADPERPVAAG